MKKDIYFKLKKPIGIYKPGKIFDCFGGLVLGVDNISFTNKEYFQKCQK